MRIGSVVIALAMISPQAFAQGTTVGALRGRLVDVADGSKAAGATVIATSPSLQGSQIVLADENGQYFLTSLPPGEYTLTIVYADRNFARAHIIVQIGKEVVVNVDIDSRIKPTAGTGGEVINLVGRAPVVDQGSTKIGATFTDDYTRNIPTGRTFSGVVGAAGGAQDDLYGVSLAGATSAENVYLVEGLDTSDTGFGGISTNLPNEFIDETEVITGGYNAEYGRATGGVINVVTKRGSNEWHGSIFGYIRPRALVADAVSVGHQGGSIDAANQLDYNVDAGGELGGPIIADKLWFHLGFNPSFTKRTTMRTIQSQIDEDGDGVPDVDANGFTRHEVVSQSEIPAEFRTYYFTSKLTGAFGPQHQWQISAFGNPRKAEDIYGTQRAPEATRWAYDDGAYDVAGKWTSKLGERTQLDAVIGYHRGFSTQKPLTASGRQSQVTYEYERSLADFADLESGLSSGSATCVDGGANDRWSTIRNCPVTSYVDQGLGFLEERLNTRRSVHLAATHRVKGLGYHIIKGGFELDSSTYDSKTYITGGTQLVRTDEGTAGQWTEHSLMSAQRPLDADERTRLNDDDPTNDPVFETDEAACAGNRVLCKRTGVLQADTTSRNIGLYLQDSWQLRPNLTFDLGVRYEQQVGYVADQLRGRTTPDGELVADRAFTLDDLLAPRLGVIYDPTSQGRAKLFAHFGRYFESVPQDVNVRGFGGEINNFTAVNTQTRTPGSPGYDPNCNVDHGTTDVAATLDACRDRAPIQIDGGGSSYVAPGLRGQFTQEIVVGAEYEIAAGWKLGASYIHRTLPTVIEDMSSDGGVNYLVGNPGENYDGAAAELDRSSAMTLAASGCTSFSDTAAGCDVDQQALAALQAGRADQLRSVKKFDKPVRDYDALQLSASQRPTKQSLVAATYTYSVSRGNYPGLFSTETGQDDPNFTSLYDLPDLMANRYGKLGLDRPHNVKLDGFYAFDLAAAGAITVGASVRAQSGIAHNALGAHPIYGQGESYLLPRGTVGRSPITTQGDIHLAYRYQAKRVGFEAFVNVFNVLDRQDELLADEIYTIDSANPVVGGTLDDLAHVKKFDDNRRETNMVVAKNPNFGHTGNNSAVLGPTLDPIQASRNVQLGFRVTW